MIVLLTRQSNNQPVSLTKQIADSGEGQVWETNLDGYLAKIYHDPTSARIAKLKVMLANPPADPMLSHNHVSIAWVSDLVKDSNGKYLGFLMPEIKNSRQLSSVYNPRRRKKVAPGFNWYYLHVTALNTAWIIQSIHAKGYVLGDIKLENILVNDRAMTAVIDTDSFQVRDSQSNKVYRCTVGSEGFTPPELLGKDFNTTNQTEICDRFRLGVLIHYLLFGYHPFSGQWTGVGESPEQTELIRQGYWYAAHNSPIRPSKTTIPLNVVHPELKKLFLKCFNEGHTKPHLRPTALDWQNAIEVAINQLTSCSRVDSHHYSKTYGKCYWCDRATDLGVDIFPGGVGKATIPFNDSKAVHYQQSDRQIGDITKKYFSIKPPSSSSPAKLQNNQQKLQLFKQFQQLLSQTYKKAPSTIAKHKNKLFVSGYVIVLILSVTQIYRFTTSYLQTKAEEKQTVNSTHAQSDDKDVSSGKSDPQTIASDREYIIDRSTLLNVEMPIDSVPRHWTYPFTKQMNDKGLVAYLSEDADFEPDHLITRASMAILISQAFADRPKIKGMTKFKDVINKNAIAQDINTAVRTGFMQGYSDSEFRPLDNISRYQVLVILARGLGLEPSQDVDQTLQQFSDSSNIPDWARQRVAAATEAGLVVNPPDVDSGSLNPERVATKAEVAAMIHQALVQIGKLEPLESEYIVKPQR